MSLSTDLFLARDGREELQSLLEAFALPQHFEEYKETISRVSQNTRHLVTNVQVVLPRWKAACQEPGRVCMPPKGVISPSEMQVRTLKMQVMVRLCAHPRAPLSNPLGTYTNNYR